MDQDATPFSRPAGEGGPRVSEGRMRGRICAANPADWVSRFAATPSSVAAARRHLLPQGGEGGTPRHLSDTSARATTLARLHLRPTRHVASQTKLDTFASSSV